MSKKSLKKVQLEDRKAKLAAIRQRLVEYKLHLDDPYSYHQEEVGAVRELKTRAAEDIEFLLAELDALIGEGPGGKTLKVKVAMYLQNNGDGSASARFFPNEALAEKVAEKDNERFCEDIATHKFEIDRVTGKVVVGIETTVEE